MTSRAEFGIHLTLTTGLVAIWALAVMLHGEGDSATVIALALAVAAALVGATLVVSRGQWPPSVTATDARRAALFGLAWGPAAALAIVLLGECHLGVALAALPVPAGLAVLATVVGRRMPEPIKAALRFLRHFS